MLGRYVYTFTFSGLGRKYPPYDVMHTCVCIYIVLNNDVVSQSLRNLTLISYLPNLASVRLSFPASIPMLGENGLCLSGFVFPLRTLTAHPSSGPRGPQQRPGSPQSRQDGGGQRRVAATGESGARGRLRDEAASEEHDAPRGHEAASGPADGRSPPEGTPSPSGGGGLSFSFTERLD